MIFFETFPCYFQIMGFKTITERHSIAFAVPHDFKFHSGRKSIYNRNTNTMKTAWKLIILIGKFSSGMQFGQNYLNAWNTLFRVNIHGHSPAVIANFKWHILIQNDLNFICKSGNCFIDTVIDYFLSQVIRPCCIGIHTRSFFYRVQTL